MMHLNGWFGNGHIWLLLFAVWFSLGALTSLVCGLIAKAGQSSDRT